jgi:hypothetical protein
MKIHYADTMKVEREEIDATEWSKNKPLLKKQFKNMLTLGEMKECRLKRISTRIGNIQYMTDALALDLERVQAIKDRLQTASKN